MFKSALAATLIAMTITSAQAEVKSVYFQGFWDVSVGTATIDSTNRMCVLQTEGDEIYYGLKYIEKADNFFLHISKNSWKIPVGTEFRYLMEFDNFGAWDLVAIAHEEMESMVESEFGNELDIDLFLKEFSIATRLYVKFPGNEGRWQLNMTGSSRAAQVFKHCVLTIRKNMKKPAPTQPFNAPKAAPTQPFSSKPVTPTAPSQPFVKPTGPEKEA